MRVEQAAAVDASEAGPRDQRVGVGEDVPLHVLLLAGPSAHLASELPVEGVLRLQRRRELVDVPLDGLACELGVHLAESHCGSVGGMA